LIKRADVVCDGSAAHVPELFQVQGSPLTFRCSQGVPEYLFEESEEDDIMIAPR
jgi:hypothetical protein